MMSKNFDENSRVKIPALIHLTRLNYKYISFKVAKNEIDIATNIYKKSFSTALNKINNKNFTDEEVTKIVRDLKNILDAENLGEEFLKKLQRGISFEEQNLKLIDFENPDTNIFEVMTEVHYQSEGESFRPDITIFINGLPLAFTEVKIPNNKEGIQAELHRMNERFAQKKYRHFANITQLMIFSNNSEYDDEEIVPMEGAFYAASDYDKIFFNRFREEENIFADILPVDEVVENKILQDTNYLTIKNTPEFEENKNPTTPTNKILTSLFSRERIIFILRYAFAYVKKTTSTGIIRQQKHIMRYQQMFAMFKIKKFLESGARRGIIWHTQGSGKTALAFYSVRYLTKYFQSKNISTQFYFVVDRLDLAQQADGEFEKRELEVNLISSKENFTRTIKHSGNAGITGKLSINVVNIQKFSDEAVTKESDFDIKVQRIYFIDEAHRDYKITGNFFKRLVKSDKNAIFIALTGTPLIGEFATRNIFGNYIHTYYYNQSIIDGYTLRLIREDIKTEYKIKIQAALSQIEKGSLPRKEIFSHASYITPLVDYIETDFTESRLRLNNNSIGAMIVCDSSEQARKICAEIKSRKNFSAELILYDEDDVKTKCDDFKKGEIDFLVVYQMLLTGFNAPRLKKIYLNRKILQHNLLQALTRVNRPYQNLRYGYVVDFADIQEEFDKTNQAYLKELQTEVGEDFNKYQKIFKTQKEIEQDLKFVRDKLFSFNTDNAEKFSKQIQVIEDKKFLFELRNAIELYKENFNLAEIYNYADLKNKFDIKKIFSLSKVIDNRINLLRQKEILNNPENISDLISLAMDEIQFTFTKISEQEMQIADSFVDTYKKTCQAFAMNTDNRDIEFISLRDELQRILKNRNIEEMTAEELRIAQPALEELLKNVRALNEKNNRLTEKYLGDKKFMRIHKRFEKNYSPTQLFEILLPVKKSIDDKILKNYAVIGNEDYFLTQIVYKILKTTLQKFFITPTLENIQNFGSVIAQEYFDERKSTH